MKLTCFRFILNLMNRFEDIKILKLYGHTILIHFEQYYTEINFNTISVEQFESFISKIKKIALNFSNRTFKHFMDELFIRIKTVNSYNNNNYKKQRYSQISKAFNSHKFNNNIIFDKKFIEKNETDFMDLYNNLNEKEKAKSTINDGSYTFELPYINLIFE